jgi:RNA polymerase sigma-70 factor (sigma-E family)
MAEEHMDGGEEFARFVRAHMGALLKTAYLLTGNRDTAEELVQDTLVRLLPKWQRVEQAEVPLAYVRRCVVNGFINDRRRPASRELVTDLLPEISDERDIASDVSDRDLVWQLLASLPVRQRAALVMRFYHDLSDEQSAEYLQCRPGTVRSLVSRALSTLRDRSRVDPAETGCSGLFGSAS